MSKRTLIYILFLVLFLSCDKDKTSDSIGAITIQHTFPSTTIFTGNKTEFTVRWEQENSEGEEWEIEIFKTGKFICSAEETLLISPGKEYSFHIIATIEGKGSITFKNKKHKAISHTITFDAIMPEIPFSFSEYSSDILLSDDLEIGITIGEIGKNYNIEISPTCPGFIFESEIRKGVDLKLDGVPVTDIMNIPGGGHTLVFSTPKVVGKYDLSFNITGEYCKSVSVKKTIRVTAPADLLQVTGIPETMSVHETINANIKISGRNGETVSLQMDTIMPAAFLFGNTIRKGVDLQLDGEPVTDIMNIPGGGHTLVFSAPKVVGDYGLNIKIIYPFGEIREIKKTIRVTAPDVISFPEDASEMSLTDIHDIMFTTAADPILMQIDTICPEYMYNSELKKGVAFTLNNQTVWRNELTIGEGEHKFSIYNPQVVGDYELQFKFITQWGTIRDVRKIITVNPPENLLTLSGDLENIGISDDLPINFSIAQSGFPALLEINTDMPKFMYNSTLQQGVDYKLDYTPITSNWQGNISYGDHRLLFSAPKVVGDYKIKFKLHFPFGVGREVEKTIRVTAPADLLQVTGIPETMSVHETINANIKISGRTGETVSLQIDTICPTFSYNGYYRRGADYKLNGQGMYWKTHLLPGNHTMTLKSPKAIGDYYITFKIIFPFGEIREVKKTINVVSPNDIIIKFYEIDPWIELGYNKNEFYESLNRDHSYSPLSSSFQGKRIDKVYTLEVPMPGYPGQYTIPGIGLTVYIGQEGSSEFARGIPSYNFNTGMLSPAIDNNKFDGKIFPSGFHCLELKTNSGNHRTGEVKYSVVVYDKWGKKQSEAITVVALPRGSTKPATGNRIPD